MTDDGRAATATTVHHIALRTHDVEATAGFYQRLLELPVVRDARPQAVWLGLGDGAVIMVEARTGGEPPIARGSMELLAFRASPARKRAVRDHAVAGGFFDGETEHTVYVRDPEGRRIGVSTYPLPDPPAAPAASEDA